MDYLNPLGNNLVYCLAVRKALGAGSTEAGAVCTRNAGGTATHFIAPGMAGHARVGYGRDVCDVVLLPRTEKMLNLLNDLPAADDDQLHSHRRSAGATCRLARMVRKFVDMMPARIHEYEALLTTNRIWQGQFKGVGYLSADQLIALSTTGEYARAFPTTIARRSRLLKEEFDFAVPTQTIRLLRAVPRSRGRDARKRGWRVRRWNKYRRGTDSVRCPR